MNGIRFEWDEAKNRANQRKHGVSFEAATAVFLDPLYFSAYERVEDGEERWQTFGVVEGALLLMVAHTVREEYAAGIVEVIRIITAREATARERRRYENENGYLHIRDFAPIDGGAACKAEGDGESPGQRN